MIGGRDGFTDGWKKETNEYWLVPDCSYSNTHKHTPMRILHMWNYYYMVRQLNICIFRMVPPSYVDFKPF